MLCWFNLYCFFLLDYLGCLIGMKGGWLHKYNQKLRISAEPTKWCLVAAVGLRNAIVGVQCR